MHIEFARGDTHEQGFILKNKATGEPITDQYDEIYFTVKKYHTDEDYKFQKRLTLHGITYDDEGRYVIHIAPDDTNELPFGTYEFDVEVVGPNYKRTFYGTMKLTKEVTHYYNE